MSRIRSQVQGPFSGTATWKQWNGNGALTGSGTYSNTSSAKKFSLSTTDEVIPGYHRRSAAGEIFNNAFSSVREVRSGTGSFHTENYITDTSVTPNVPYGRLGFENDGSGEFYVVYYADSLTVPPPTGDTASLSSLLAVSGNASLANINPTEFNLPLFVAEWAKTVGMYQQTVDMLSKQMIATLQLLRGRRGARTKFAKTSSKNLANAWLLTRFGVTPLLYELQGAYGLLSNPKPIRQTARGSASDAVNLTKTFTISDGNQYPSIYTFRWDRTIELTTRSGVLYEAEINALNRLASLGITRPATIAWELVPFSFVVDRLVDIGTWLDAMQPAGSYKQLSAWEGWRHVVSDHIFTTGAVQRPPEYGTKVRNCSYVVDYWKTVTTKSRVPWAATPSLPSWNPQFNYKHCLDYLSLGIQRVKRFA